MGKTNRWAARVKVKTRLKKKLTKLGRRDQSNVDANRETRSGNQENLFPKSRGFHHEPLPKGGGDLGQRVNGKEEEKKERKKGANERGTLPSRGVKRGSYWKKVQGDAP